MSDDKTKMDGRDRSKVAGEEDYEVEFFAKQNKISLEEARRLINQFGNDRDKLELEARKLKA